MAADWKEEPLPGHTAASTETTDQRRWYTIDQGDIEKLASFALSDHTARLDKVSRPKQIGDNVIEIQGTTTDGRTFRSEVTFFVKDMALQSVAKTHVEGTVSMGPVPDALSKMESSVARLLSTFKSVGYQNIAVEHLSTRFDYIAGLIEDWRRGEIVDMKTLRSELRDAIKRIAKAHGEMNDTFRMMIPPGESKPLWQLTDATRKTIGAAARGLE